MGEIQPKKKKLTPVRKRKPKGKLYFTQLHEDAIVEYAREETELVRRQELYTKYIGPTFNEMVDKIVFTYKFTSLPNVDDLKSECKVFLTTVLGKFDPAKGSKAFSYFSVITKNWFIHKVKKNSLQMKREVYYDDMSKDSEFFHMSVENDYEDKREKHEFWQDMWQEMGKWDAQDLKDNERKVLEAIKILLADPEAIEIFNKKAIYLYIREITGLNTKQVVSNLNRIRKKYHLFKRKWNQA